MVILRAAHLEGVGRCFDCCCYCCDIVADVLNNVVAAVAHKIVNLQAIGIIGMVSLCLYFTFLLGYEFLLLTAVHPFWFS